MPLLLAHAGHILIDAPLFLGPVVVLGIALYVSTRRERERQRREGGG
jgi:hypothetical protein